MKRSELKNRVQSNAKLSPDYWGNTCVIIDETLACEAMVQCGMERDDEGTLMTADDFLDQLSNDSQGDVDIFEFNGDYFAVEISPQRAIGGGRYEERDPLYIQCDDPESVSYGSVLTYGVWKSFDYEDDVAN